MHKPRKPVGMPACGVWVICYDRLILSRSLPSPSRGRQRQANRMIDIHSLCFVQYTNTVVCSRSAISMTIGWKKELKCDSCMGQNGTGTVSFRTFGFFFVAWVHDMLRFWKKPCLIVASATNEVNTPTGAYICINVSKCNNMIVSFFLWGAFRAIVLLVKDASIRGAFSFCHTYLPFYLTSQWKTLI